MTPGHLPLPHSPDYYRRKQLAPLGNESGPKFVTNDTINVFIADLWLQKCEYVTTAD